jgi:hypothetical protein
MLDGHTRQAASCELGCSLKVVPWMILFSNMAASRVWKNS